MNILLFSQCAWKKLKRIYKRENAENFPKCIESLVYTAGYNQIASLTKIDDEKIQDIERFFNENRNYINLLNCCYSDEYKRMTNFRFLPAHRAVIKGIPDLLKKIINIEQQKKSTNHLSNDNLIKKLVDAMKNVPKKAGFPNAAIAITENNIHNFHRIDEATFRCTFQCPFCVKTFSLKHKKFWMSSNASKHLKEHITEFSNLQQESHTPGSNVNLSK